MKSGWIELESEAPAPDMVWELNFHNLWLSFTHNPKYFHCHWLWKKAMENPDTWIVYDYWEETDKKRFYRKYARFNSLTHKMETSLDGCPVSFNHHVGSTCGVCGMRD